MVPGLLRTSIVRYGDFIQDPEMDRTIIADSRCLRLKLLIVAGTSCKVSGFVNLLQGLSARVRANGGLVVMINDEPVNLRATGMVDIFVQMRVEVFFHMLATALGWLLNTPTATDIMAEPNIGLAHVYVAEDAGLAETGIHHETMVYVCPTSMVPNYMH